MMFSKCGQAVLTVHERASHPLLGIRLASKAARDVAHHLVRRSRAFRRAGARLSPSTMAPSSPRTRPCRTSRSRPSSAILTRLDRKASRTRSAGCGTSSRAKLTSPPCQAAASARSLPPTTTPRAQVLHFGCESNMSTGHDGEFTADPFATDFHQGAATESRTRAAVVAESDPGGVAECGSRRSA